MTIPSAIFQPLFVQLGATLVGLSEGQNVQALMNDLSRPLQEGMTNPSLALALEPLRSSSKQRANEMNRDQMITALGRTITSLHLISDEVDADVAGQMRYMHQQWTRLLPPDSSTASLQHAAQLFQATPSRMTSLGRSPGGELLLTVDDEPMISRAIMRVLRGYGYAEFLQAQDGRIALELVRERGREISAVVTDVDMPHMNGIELTRELHTLYPDMPVIMMSGYSLDSRAESDRTFLQGLSRFAYLDKPPDPREILWTLRCLIDSGKV